MVQTVPCFKTWWLNLPYQHQNYQVMRWHIFCSTFPIWNLLASSGYQALPPSYLTLSLDASSRLPCSNNQSIIKLGATQGTVSNFPTMKFQAQLNLKLNLLNNFRGPCNHFVSKEHALFIICTWSSNPMVLAPILSNCQVCFLCISEISNPQALTPKENQIQYHCLLLRFLLHLLFMHAQQYMCLPYQIKSPILLFLNMLHHMQNVAFVEEIQSAWAF